MLEFCIKSIIFNVLIRYNFDFKSRSESLRKLTIDDKQHILPIIKRDFKIKYKTFIAEIEIYVHHDIIYRILKEKEIIK